MRKTVVLIALMAVAAASQASFTVATFADPSPTGTTPLFKWDQNANTLSGGWTTTGLTLETPGFVGGGSVANAHFVMDPVALSVVIPNQLYLMGPGSIRFYTADPNTPFFTISFQSGTFLNPLNAGGASANGNGVTFAGPDLPGPLMNEAFAFSFANPNVGAGSVSYTASFTSSADIVPEPATVLALAAGLAAVARRRKA